jgi:hypothetical protein
VFVAGAAAIEVRQRLGVGDAEIVRGDRGLELARGAVRREAGPHRLKVAVAFLTGIGVKLIYGTIENIIDALSSRLTLSAVRGSAPAAPAMVPPPTPAAAAPPPLADARLSSSRRSPRSSACSPGSAATMAPSTASSTTRHSMRSRAS